MRSPKGRPELTLIGKDTAIMSGLPLAPNTVRS